MYNAIRLLKGESSLTKKEFEKFEKGGTIWGVDTEAAEVERWSIDQKEAAEAAFKKYKCSYRNYIDLTDVVEYALEYFECDEEGEFIAGSDYYLADAEQ